MKGKEELPTSGQLNTYPAIFTKQDNKTKRREQQEIPLAEERIVFKESFFTENPKLKADLLQTLDERLIEIARERAALEALSQAIQGKPGVELVSHLSTLKHHEPGKRIRRVLRSAAEDFDPEIIPTRVSQLVDILTSKEKSIPGISPPQPTSCLNSIDRWSLETNTPAHVFIDPLPIPGNKSLEQKTESEKTDKVNIKVQKSTPLIEEFTAFFTSAAIRRDIHDFQTRPFSELSIKPNTWAGFHNKFAIREKLGQRAYAYTKEFLAKKVLNPEEKGMIFKLYTEFWRSENCILHIRDTEFPNYRSSRFGLGLGDSRESNFYQYQPMLAGFNLAEAFLTGDFSRESFYFLAVKLKGACFSNIDLSHSHFEDCDLSAIKTEEVNFSHVCFKTSKFKEANLNGTFLTGAWFKSCRLKEANLEPSKCSQVGFDECDIDYSNLSQKRDRFFKAIHEQTEEEGLEQRMQRMTEPKRR